MPLISIEGKSSAMALPEAMALIAAMSREALSDIEGSPESVSGGRME
jgi:hypothetical protein